MPREEPRATGSQEEKIVYDTLENSMASKLKPLNLPSWSAFNLAISTDVVRTRTKKIYFPFIPGPAKDYSAIYTALMLSQGISVHAVGDGERTIVTMDLDLYERAYLLIHSRDDLREKFVLRLGELHVIFAQLRAIGTYIDQSGIEKSWLQGDCIGSGTVDQILNCSHMKRAIHMHEVTLISLYSVLMRDFRLQNPWIFNGPNGHLFNIVNKINNACKGKNWKLVGDLNKIMINELIEIRFTVEKVSCNIFSRGFV